VPFDFLKRKKGPTSGVASPPPPGTVGVGLAFDGLTEDWRLIGRMLIASRLSDALNKREPIAISDVSWAPTDGSAPMAPAPGLKSVDPYDLVLVLAGDDTLPAMNPDERNEQRVHKVSYEVALEVPPYRVYGTVYLYPGSDPATLLNRSSEMFLPVVDATATMGDEVIGEARNAAILVNRAYLRGVEQVDARTGEPHVKLPGAPLGGVNWTDRAR
jgi:hypothetical protein